MLYQHVLVINALSPSGKNGGDADRQAPSETSNAGR
jgi:hypothetical protein